MTLIETVQLEIGYALRGGRQPRVLARDLELGATRGQLVCLMGPNGSGKSTLLRVLAGLQDPLAGEVLLEGEAGILAQPRLRARKLSVVLSQVQAIGLLRVEEAVALGRHPHTGWFGRLAASDLEAISRALKSVGVAALRTRRLHTLSDGERQRVLVARALAQDTPLILLDEPTAHLDLPHRVQLFHLLRRLSREQNRTFILSTHELDLALRYGDCLWLLDNQGGCRTGSASELLDAGILREVFACEGIDDLLKGFQAIER